MAVSFDEYLNEQKQSNRYTSEYNLDEGKIWDKIRGADKEKTGAAVKINFTDEKVVKHISDILEARATLTSDQTLTNSKNFSEMVQEQIAIYVNTLAKLFNKNHGHKVVKNKNDHELWYIFEKYNDKDPYAYAKSFIRSIEAQGDGVNAISFLAEICGKPTDAEFTKRELEDNKKANNTFNDPDKKPEDIVGSNFIVNVTKAIYNKVKNILDKNDELQKRGKQITVYSIPYKISDESIKTLATETKKENGNVGAFYNKLVEKINKNIVSFLNELDKESLAEYLGIVPVKTYGFNLYFKERDLAEQAAEELNQDGSDVKVTERKRYEGKIANRPKLLSGSTTINDVELSGIADAGVWLQGTRFGIEHINGVISDIYPDAKTSREVKIATVKVDKDWLTDMCKDQTNNTPSIYAFVTNIKTKVIEALVEHSKSGNENVFVSASSEGPSLVFIFTKDASSDNIETYLNGIVPTSAKVSIRKGAFTESEIKGHQELMRKIVDETNVEALVKEKFTSLFTEVSKWIDKENSNADEEQAKADKAAGEKHDAVTVQFKFDKVNNMTPEQKTELLTNIDNIKFTDSFGESFSTKLYQHLIESLHLNEMANKLTPEDRERIKNAKTEEEKTKILEEIEKRPETTSATDTGSKKTSSVAKKPVKKAAVAKKMETIKAATNDLKNNPEKVSPNAVLELVANKIANIMDIISIKVNGKISTTFDGDNQSITIEYPVKAKDLVGKYLTAFKRALSEYMNIQG